MSGVAIGIFLATAFCGGIVIGLAGFAMGLVVSGIWLQILSPIETASLIVGYGMLTQSYNIWRLRHALRWRRVAPFIVGGTVGVPVGTFLLTYVEPHYVRLAVGLLLIGYGTYFLARPHFKPINPGKVADVAIGFLNGTLGGMTGLAGPIITIWCQLRGFSKDEQRSVFQPVILAAFVMTAISLSVAGAVTPQLARLYVSGLLPLAAGLWIGLKLYGRLDEATFRKAILLLLLLAGLALILLPHA